VNCRTNTRERKGRGRQQSHFIGQNQSASVIRKSNPEFCALRSERIHEKRKIYRGPGVKEN